MKRKAYTPTHAHLGDGKGLWRGLCGRCGAQTGGGKQLKPWGLVCNPACPPKAAK